MWYGRENEIQSMACIMQHLGNQSSFLMAKPNQTKQAQTIDDDALKIDKEDFLHDSKFDALFFIMSTKLDKSATAVKAMQFS